MNDAYAVATVIGRKPPVSSHLGDRAIVHAEGRMEGFIGGACSRDIIRRQALQAIRTGEPRLVRIRPDARELLEQGDIVTVPMSCISEGAVDVFIEPHVPRRRLLIAGLTPVAHALAQMAPALEFDVVRFFGQAEMRDNASPDDAAAFAIDSLEAFLQELESEQRARAVAIAASQGHYDERALAEFLQHDIGFVGLLASRTRAAAILDALVHEGISAERARAIHYPVGLAIGARKPAEVAVSILAEIITAGSRPTAASAQEVAGTAVDPVCGMTVEIPAQHRADFDDHTYDFCSAHCRASFVKRPEQYLAAATL